MSRYRWLENADRCGHPGLNAACSEDRHDIGIEMGIRTQCPNGHRLNLKQFLAGRRALCPHCGARFRIPLESTDRPQPFAAAPSRGVGGPARQHAMDRGHIAAGRPGERHPQVSGVDPPAGRPQPHQWFVYTPTGEQYGPATDSVFHEWIAEQRIQPECWVWRDDWDAWQPASKVLKLSETPSAGPGQGGSLRVPAPRSAAERPTEMPALARSPSSRDRWTRLRSAPPAAWPDGSGQPVERVARDAPEAAMGEVDGVPQVAADLPSRALPPAGPLPAPAHQPVPTPEQSDLALASDRLRTYRLLRRRSRLFALWLATVVLVVLLPIVVGVVYMIQRGQLHFWRPAP